MMRSLFLALVGALLATACFAQERPRDDRATLIQVAPGVRPVMLETAALAVEQAGGTVRTTIEMTFRNPNARVLEGNLQFPLQPGQQVVAFALDVDGHMRAAVPVEKERGRQVLEAIERRGADPGLLEQTQGDFFRLRIYPFAPHGTRTVRVTLSEAAQAGATRLPLDFADGLAALPLTVHAARSPAIDGALRPLGFQRQGRGTWALALHPGDVAPGRGLRLTFADAAAPAVQAQAWHGARYVAADLPVTLVPQPRALPAHMTLLWDSSASGAGRAHDLEFALLDAYFHATRGIDVDLVRFRDTVDAPVHFSVHTGDWSALRRELETTVYDGATTLRGWTPTANAGDTLLFSDGLFNDGAFVFPAFGPQQRLYTVRAGVAGDSARLRALAAGRGGDAIELDGAAQLPAMRDRLLQDAPRIVGIDALGVADLRAASSVIHEGSLRIAGRLTDAAPRLAVEIASGSQHRTIDVPLASAVDGDAAASLWAGYELARLLEAPDANHAAIVRLGGDFGIVTPGSSLIVLERVDDYLRYDIAPPAELRADYDRLAAEETARRDAARVQQLDKVRAGWNERIRWWTTAFPKNAPPAPKRDAQEERRAEQSRRDADRVVAEAAEAEDAATAAPQPAPAAAPPPPEPAATLDRVEVTATRIDPADLVGAANAPAQLAIQLQPWTSDSPFARRLRTLDADAAYQAYLDERTRTAAGPAFYLDVADVLFDKQRPALALRVLSNLAELDLDNRHVLRVLAYRRMQAGRADLAVPVLEDVLTMGDDEPQSYRDLAQAEAALGHRQKAIDLLYEVVAGTWDARFPDIEMTALAELNALVATSPAPLDTRRIAPDLLKNMPLALRTVLSWDADNSDMDLWVTDPNGEKAYYGNRLTYQGGHMSADFTGGYGPEEFALRAAKPGKYKVEANYFGDRQQVVTGATTLQLWLSARFGTPQQQDQRVTLRLKDKKETVFVGEFEVR